MKVMYSKETWAILLWFCAGGGFPTATCLAKLGELASVIALRLRENNINSPVKTANKHISLNLNTKHLSNFSAHTLKPKLVSTCKAVL